MTPEEVRNLYDYNAWANRRQMNAASALTPEQFTKPLGSSFSSVRDTLAHICGAEWIWDEVHGWMGLADLSADSARPACNQPTCVSPSPPQR